MNTSSKAANPNRFADKIAGFSDPSMGDERERDVLLRAYTYAMQVGLYLCLAGAVVFAAIGAGLWSMLPIAAAAIPSMAAMGYARRENVDLTLLTARASRSRRTWALAVTILCIALWCGALSYQQVNGHALFNVSFGRFAGGNSVAGAIGMLVGAAIGMIAALVFRRVEEARAIRRSQAPEAVDDED